MSEPIKRRITAEDIEAYKRDILDQSVLVKAADAARVLSCSTRKLYNLARDGQIAAYNEQAGMKGMRFLASELRDYVRSLKIDLDSWRE